MRIVLNQYGVALSKEDQRNWRYADSIGLRPSDIRYLNGKPMAVFKDGTGIYGPCPEAPADFEATE